HLLQEDFALIILDVQMPEMDGFETARLIHERDRTRDIPIIFLTAIYKNEAHRERGYTIGAVDYILKPFDPLMLRTKVGSFIELGRKRAELQAEIHRRQQVETELVRLNATLERQVEERTKALAAANQKLEQAARAKDQFLAMLAHELRNPLAPLLTLSERLLHTQHDPVAIREASQLLERSVKHLVRLIDDLLDVTRIASGKINLEKKPVAFPVIVEQALEQVRPWLDRHHFVATLPEEPVWLEGDPSRLLQVLSNLLHNAAKFTAQGGAITLSAERAAGELVIKIIDNGIGIPGELLAEVFEPFRQVDTSIERSQGGLGIGLALVKTLVEMHGGTVRAASGGTGRGSEFVVRLPVLTEVPELPAPTDAARPVANPGRRLLVVDDNVDAAESLAVMLGMWGYTVETAYDGLSAIERAQAKAPDGAILDIGLPQMNGYDVARRLRADPATRGALLIALSGYGQAEDRQRAREAGFDHHFVKPIEPSALRAWLAKHWQAGHDKQLETDTSPMS
ncbi:MAG: response regulator, partial [Gammaproteobacteria bacterium]